jgi:hypothetical protein
MSSACPPVRSSSNFRAAHTKSPNVANSSHDDVQIRSPKARCTAMRLLPVALGPPSIDCNQPHLVRHLHAQFVAYSSSSSGRNLAPSQALRDSELRSCSDRPVPAPQDLTSTQRSYWTETTETSACYRSMRRWLERRPPNNWRKSRNPCKSTPLAPIPHHVASTDPRGATSTQPHGSVTMRPGGRTPA